MNKTIYILKEDDDRREVVIVVDNINEIVVGKAEHKSKYATIYFGSNFGTEITKEEYDDILKLLQGEELIDEEEFEKEFSGK